MNKQKLSFWATGNSAKFAVALALAGAFALPSATQAATEAGKKAAIDAGLEWLALNQQGNGRWIYDNSYGDTAATGASLLSFLEEGYKAGSDVIINGNNYGDVVGDGLNYLFNQAQIVSISNQPAGNPDGDGNRVGLKFVLGGDNPRDTYVTGLVVPAIASTMTPDALVKTGPLAARTDGSGLDGAWTYKDVVQNTIDYFAFGQSDPATGNNRGGWRYYANYGNSASSDQSTTQWPVISELYASLMDVSSPSFVNDELDYWTKYIQNYPGPGNAGYDGPLSPAGEMNETGALLIMQDVLGYSTGTAEEQARLQAALGYIDTHWQETANSTWDGNFGHPYAMWAIYKGLELTCGLDDTTCITNLNPRGSAMIDDGDTWNWAEEYWEYLVNTQNTDGSWAGYDYWNNVLATPWYINILAATKIPGPEPKNVPEPSTNATLALLGFLGLGAIIRKNLHQKRLLID
jgi:hypothetical protein